MYSKYITDIRDRIMVGCHIARENLKNAGEVQRQYINKGRKLITLKNDEEMLVSLQSNENTLLTSSHGPFNVVKRISAVDYVVNIRRCHKVFNVNIDHIYPGQSILLRRTSLERETSRSWQPHKGAAVLFTSSL